MPVGQECLACGGIQIDATESMFCAKFSGHEDELVSIPRSRTRLGQPMRTQATLLASRSFFGSNRRVAAPQHCSLSAHDPVFDTRNTSCRAATSIGTCLSPG